MKRSDNDCDSPIALIPQVKNLRHALRWRCPVGTPSLNRCFLSSGKSVPLFLNLLYNKVTPHDSQAFAVKKIRQDGTDIFILIYLFTNMLCIDVPERETYKEATGATKLQERSRQAQEDIRLIFLSLLRLLLLSPLISQCPVHWPRSSQ